MLRRVLRCRKGATGIEYALIASLLSVGGIVAFEATKDSTNATYCAVAGSMARHVGFDIKGCGEGTPQTPDDQPQTPPMLIAWGMGIGSDDEHQCQYRFNYGTSLYDLDTSADNRGACANNVGPGTPGYSPPPQENIDEWNKGGRDPYGN